MFRFIFIILVLLTNILSWRRGIASDLFSFQHFYVIAWRSAPPLNNKCLKNCTESEDGVFNNNSSICGKQSEVKYKILYNNYRQQDGCSVKDAAGSLQGAASCHTNASQPERGLPLPEHIRAR